ncbi:MAG: hypothetical protein ACJAVK_000905 [Akkermansiaceae bacterium]
MLVPGPQEQDRPINSFIRDRLIGTLPMLGEPLNPSSQEVAVVEEMLPLFGLSLEQETEIREILDDRTEKQAR